MSKKKNAQPMPLVPNELPVANELSVVNEMPVISETSEVNKLSDIDRVSLELAKQQRLTALAEAKTAIAQNEKAELSYKYIVLQIYMKYGLTDADAISESGDIIRGGALPQRQLKTQ